MRVCFYHADARTTEWPGRARAFAEAARALKSRGWEVAIVCEPGSEAQHRFEATGCDVVTVSSAGGWVRNAWRLRRVLARQLSEVVFVHGERDQLIAAAAARMAGRAAVVRRVPPLGRLSLGNDGRLAMRLAATGFLFAFEEDLRAARPPARALELVVAPPAASLDEPHAPGATDSARVIACLTDATHAPRMTTALRALAMLAERHDELRVLAVGPWRGDDVLRVHATALGLGDRISFVSSAAPDEVLRPKLRAAHAAWVLADGDDAVYGVLDAFALGVPVIWERNPLSSRIAADGEAGVLPAGLDASGYAALIATLLAADGGRARLAWGARTAALRWPVEPMAAGFERAALAARDRTRWQV